MKVALGECYVNDRYNKYPASNLTVRYFLNSSGHRGLLETAEPQILIRHISHESQVVIDRHHKVTIGAVLTRADSEASLISTNVYWLVHR